MRVINAIFLIGFILLKVTPVHASQWWLNPPEDNTQFIYGIGQGATLTEAQQNALADISGKLSTNISSSLDRITQDTGINYSDSVRRQIRSEVKDTELSQFQLVNSRVEGTKTTALLQLDRIKLTLIWQNQINETTSKLGPMLQAKTIPDVQHWLELKRSLPAAEKSRNLSVKLFALNGVKPGRDLHFEIQQLLLKHPMRVAIKGPLPKLNRALQQQFGKIGFVNCNSNCNLTIAYQYSAEHELMFGEYLSSAKIIYELYEQQNLIAVAEKGVQITSISSHKSADEGSIAAIVNDLQSRGLIKVLGLRI